MATGPHGLPSTRQHPRPSAAFLAAALVLIGLATLPPQSAVPETRFLCLYCGEGAIADGLLNVALFVPLGLALAWRYRGVVGPIAAGALLSGAIELAQVWIPGRDSSLSDIVSNSLGTAIGVLVLRRAGGLAPLLRGRPSLLGGLAGVAGLLVLTGGAFLLGPSYPEGPYWVRWGTAVRVAVPFEGQVERASVGGIALWPGPTNRGGRVREALLAGRAMVMTARIDALPTAMAGIVSVSQGDLDVAVLGADGPAAVARFSTRSLRWGLRQPDLRFEGALARLRPPATVLMRAWQRDRGYCLQVGLEVDCSLGYTVGDGWSLLAGPGGFPDHARRLLGIAWIALVLAPGGFWLRRTRDRVAFSIAALLAVWLAPRAFSLLPAPPAQLLAAPVGVWAAAALHQAIRRLVPPRPPAPGRTARSAGS